MQENILKVKKKDVLNQDKYDNKINRNETNKKSFHAEEIKKLDENYNKNSTNVDNSLIKSLFDSYNSNNNTNLTEKIINFSDSLYYYNENILKDHNNSKSLSAPIITINLDDKIKNGNISSLIRDEKFLYFNNIKSKLKNDDINNTIHILKDPELNYNSDLKQNGIINKNISEELLNSFKNLFSNFALDKQKGKQTLNLYLNGNISINLLTGNSNPQIITKNVYNKDSYNTNKTISYNSNFESKENQTKKYGKKLNKNEMNSVDIESSSNKIKNLIKQFKNQKQSNDTNQIFINKELIKNKNNIIEMDRKRLKGDNDEDNDSESSNIFTMLNQVENKNKLEINEDRIKDLLNDEELKDLLKKKIGLNSRIKNNNSKIDITV